MKVLFVNTSDTHGGAARAALRIMNGVQARGVECTELVKSKNSLDDRIRSIDEFCPGNALFRLVDYVVLKIKNKWQHLKWRPYLHSKESYFMSDLRSMSFHGALKELDFDIVHLHWINNRFMNLRELRKVGKPIVWTLHDSWPFCGICHYSLDCEKYKTHCGACPHLHSDLEKDLSFEVFEKKARLLDGLKLHIVTPSNWLGNCVKSSRILGQYPVTVIPNPIDTDVFAPCEAGVSISKWGKVINYNPAKHYALFGAVNATTDRIKGYTKLLSALEKYIQMENAPELELIVFGVDKPLDGLSSVIPTHYLGYVMEDADLASLYSLADVTVVPSLTENLSNTIMESLSCGTPVVAFNIGGNSDMIDHRQNGYLATDEVDLARGIEWCMNNAVNADLGASARNKVLAGFSSVIVSEKYSRLYDSLM